LAIHLSDIFFPTPIRDLKAEIFEVHNGFIHHEKKVASVFGILLKFFEIKKSVPVDARP